MKESLFNLSGKIKAEKLSFEHGELDIDGSKIRGSGGPEVVVVVVVVVRQTPIVRRTESGWLDELLKVIAN